MTDRAKHSADQVYRTVVSLGLAHVERKNMVLLMLCNSFKQQSSMLSRRFDCSKKDEVLVFDALRSKLRLKSSREFAKTQLVSWLT